MCEIKLRLSVPLCRAFHEQLAVEAVLKVSYKLSAGELPLLASAFPPLALHASASNCLESK